MGVDFEAVAGDAATIAGFVIGSYLGILVHELGHALAARLVGFHPRLVVIGRGPILLRLPLGPAWVVIRAVPSYGYAARLPDPDRRRVAQAVVVAAGPLASLALAIVAACSFQISFGVAPVEASEVLLGIAVPPAAQFVTSLWPRTFAVKGHPRRHATDGCKLLLLARRGEIDDFEGRYAAFLRPVLAPSAPVPAPSAFAPELLFQLHRRDLKDEWARQDMAAVIVRVLLSDGPSEAERAAVAARYDSPTIASLARTGPRVLDDLDPAVVE